ncbi:MAG: TonB family protein [Parvibaculum sp.]|nr:TonB family protein [Parvibaculum sp.]
MSMAATARIGSMAREEGSSPLLLAPRTLRGPVAASLFLHVSVAAVLLGWWQTAGTSAPQGIPDGMSVTFVELSAPAPARVERAAPSQAAPPAPQPEILPDPVSRPVPETITEAIPLPELVAPRPERKPAPQPRISEARAPAADTAPAFRTASFAPPDARDGDGAGTRAGLAPHSGAEESEIVTLTEPRYRVPPRPPAYPRRARDLGQEGTAMIRVRLDLAGNPAEISLLESSGYALLDHAAMKAARDWQFEPERRGGRPVAAFVHIPVRFALN